MEHVHNGVKCKHIEVINVKGSSQVCEDTLIHNDRDGVFGVIDGATSVTPYQNGRGETGGLLAARLLVSFLENVPRDVKLLDVVMQANRSLRQWMADAGVDLSCKKNYWCAAFALFRIHEEGIEYAHAGDCMLFVRYEDGMIRQLTHDQVAHMDSISIRKREEARQNGCVTLEEIRDYVLPTIAENRENANTLRGYSVFNGEPELAHFMESGWINRIRLKRIYAFTDGLFDLTARKEYGINWEGVLDQMDKLRLQGYAENLIKREEEDRFCVRFPRHKTSDDKTGILIEL